MKISESSLTKIAECFLAEVCASYDMPELLTAATRSERPAGTLATLATPMKALTFRGQIVPRGQMAAIAETLDVEVVVSGGNKSVLTGFVSLNYQHRGGGSNGFTTRFLIATVSRYTEHEYAGHVEASVLSNIQSALRD